MSDSGLERAREIADKAGIEIAISVFGSEDGHPWSNRFRKGWDTQRNAVAGKASEVLCKLLAEYARSAEKAAIERCCKALENQIPKDCEGCRVGEEIVEHQDSEWHGDGCGNPWEPCHSEGLRHVLAAIREQEKDVLK